MSITTLQTLLKTSFKLNKSLKMPQFTWRLWPCRLWQRQRQIFRIAYRLAIWNARLRTLRRSSHVSLSASISARHHMILVMLKITTSLPTAIRKPLLVLVLNQLLMSRVTQLKLRIKQVQRAQRLTIILCLQVMEHQIHKFRIKRKMLKYPTIHLRLLKTPLKLHKIQQHLLKSKPIKVKQRMLQNLNLQ